MKPPSQRPRVLQVITHLALGGAEAVAATLQRTLQDQCDFGLFAVQGQSGDSIGRATEEEMRQLGIPWFSGTPLPLKLGGAAPAALALARAVRTFRPDIIHLHAEHAELTAAVWRRFLAPRNTSPVFVRTVHNSIFWRSWPRLGRWCERQLHAAAVTCVSTAAAQEFARHRAGSGARPPLCAPRVIPNAVTLPTQPPREAPREPHRVRVLAAGRFEPQKGFDVLLRAVPHTLLPEGVRGELVVHGRGSQDQELRALAATAPATWQVEIAPPLENLAAHLREFDVVVIPSRFEGLSLFSLEATHAGLPVVATRAPGLSETLPPEHPWLAPPDDPPALAGTLADALRRTERWTPAVRAAQVWGAERFSPSAMTRGYWQLYSTVLSATRAGRAPAAGP
jgi:glycosyltransferase involved in cell wall biosynthesis